MSAGLVVGIVLGAVVVFSAAPAMTMLLRIFLRRDVSARAFDRAYLQPFRAPIGEALAFFDGQPLREVETVSADGTRLVGSYLDGGHGKTVIFFHGYRATAMSNFCMHARLLYDWGFDLLFVDERAHGRSGGGYTSLGVREREDVLAWLAWAREHVPGQQLLLYGISMGSIATALAADSFGPDTVRAMVLDCSYTSVASVLLYDARCWHVPWFLVLPWMRLYARLIFRLDLDRSAEESLKKATVPALFFHGLSDSAVPVEETRRNYAACASEKELYLVPGAEHTMSLPEGGAEAEDVLRRFLEKYFGSSTTPKEIET